MTLTATRAQTTVLDPARPRMPRQPATLEVGDLAYRPSAPTLSFVVRPGESIGLHGLAGSGKTTVVHALGGLSTVDRGSITLTSPGCRDRRGPRVVGRGGVVLVPADVSLPGRSTVEATLRFWASTRRAIDAPNAPGDDVERALLGVGLTSWRHRAVVDCHQVVRRALAVAVALLSEPAVLVLDEPWRPVAPRHRGPLLALLRALSERGLGVVYASRHHDELGSVCRTVLPLTADAAAQDPVLLPVHQRAG